MDLYGVGGFEELKLKGDRKPICGIFGSKVRNIAKLDDEHPIWRKAKTTPSHQSSCSRIQVVPIASDDLEMQIK